jgi:hypothetical protein
LNVTDVLLKDGMDRELTFGGLYVKGFSVIMFVSVSRQPYRHNGKTRNKIIIPLK